MSQQAYEHRDMLRQLVEDAERFRRLCDMAKGTIVHVGSTWFDGDHLAEAIDQFDKPKQVETHRNEEEPLPWLEG